MSATILAELNNHLMQVLTMSSLLRIMESRKTILTGAGTLENEAEFEHKHRHSFGSWIDFDRRIVKDIPVVAFLLTVVHLSRELRSLAGWARCAPTVGILTRVSRLLSRSL